MASGSVAQRRPAGGGAAAFRSPIPLLMGGILVALLLVLVVALPGRTPPTDPAASTTLGEPEALTLVAEKMRSGEAALEVVTRGRARFEEGTWRVSVGEARFYFTTRNRVVVAENDAARALQFRDPTPGPAPLPAR